MLHQLYQMYACCTPTNGLNNCWVYHKNRQEGLIIELELPVPAPPSPLDVFGVDLPRLSEGFRRSRGEYWFALRVEIKSKLKKPDTRN